MKLASIVVPVYQVEAYIAECIESLTAQTYKNIEILLVDDGSPDRSGKICDAYAQKDSRIRVLHKQNGGVSDARNRGIQEARGEYLFFVDGDDFAAPVLVEKTISCAQKQQADIVIFDYEAVEEGTGRRDFCHFHLPENQIFNVKSTPEILLKNPSPWSRMYRRQFWEETGAVFPQGIHYEDLAIIPRLALKAERIAYMGGEPLYYYRLRQGSIMTSRNFENNYKDRTCALNGLREYFRKNQAEEMCHTELEYLFFEHGYFVPSKEIILADAKSPWLQSFRQYVLENYPGVFKNPYIRQLSKKDKLLLFLMKRGQYSAMNFLSGLRRAKDSMKKAD